MKDTGSDDETKSKITDKLSRITANIQKNLISGQNNVNRSFLVNERDLLAICQLGNIENESTNQSINHTYIPIADGWAGAG